MLNLQFLILIWETFAFRTVTEIKMAYSGFHWLMFLWVVAARSWPLMGAYQYGNAYNNKRKAFFKSSVFLRTCTRQYLIPQFFLKVCLFLASLGICCCAWALSGCSAQDSHWGGFSCGAQALGVQASVVVALRLGSCSSWALENGLSSCGTRA